jgi:hypothetical protein
MAVQLSFICCRITVWMWRRLGCSTYAVPPPFLDFSASNCIGRTRRYWKDGLRSGLRCMILASFRKRFRANARTCSQPYGAGCRAPARSTLFATTVLACCSGRTSWQNARPTKGWFGPQTEYYECGLDYWARAATGHHGQPPHEDGSWYMHFHRYDDPAAIFEFTTDIRNLIFVEQNAAIPTMLDAGLLRMGEPAPVLVDRRSGRSRGLAGLEHGLLRLSGRTRRSAVLEGVLGARQGTSHCCARPFGGIAFEHWPRTAIRCAFPRHPYPIATANMGCSHRTVARSADLSARGCDRRWQDRGRRLACASPNGSRSGRWLLPGLADHGYCQCDVWTDRPALCAPVRRECQPCAGAWSA